MQKTQWIVETYALAFLFPDLSETISISYNKGYCLARATGEGLKPTYRERSKTIPHVRIKAEYPHSP
jgi:hypothetical protein